MAIEVVKNERHETFSGSIAGDVRISIISQARMIYLGLKQAFELSDEEMIEVYKEAIGEEAGKIMYELGANAEHDNILETVLANVAEEPGIYHEFIDELAK